MDQIRRSEPNCGPSGLLMFIENLSDTGGKKNPQTTPLIINERKSIQCACPHFK